MDETTKERVVAIVRLAVMLASAVAGGFGIALDADALFTLAMCAVALASGVYNWWKNANLTKAAVQAQHYLDAIKSGDEEGE